MFLHIYHNRCTRYLYGPFLGTIESLKLRVTFVRQVRHDPATPNHCHTSAFIFISTEIYIFYTGKNRNGAHTTAATFLYTVRWNIHTYKYECIQCRLYR